MINDEINRRSRKIASYLTPRLMLIAKACVGAQAIADIGTDHAYVPIYAVLEQGAKSAIAADINHGPLMRAEANIRKFKLEDKITTKISDGLKNFECSDADTIVIAGMGGTLIARILDDSPQMKKKGIRFVLQPMTAEEELRKFLEKNGYKTIDEFMTSEGEKLYTVIVAEVGAAEKQEEVFYHVSRKLFLKKDELFKVFLERKINEFKKVREGLLKANESDENSRKAEYYLRLYDELLKLKGECEKW